VKTIISAQNKRYKDWKKLLTKKGREQQSAYLLEGPHLIQEALKESGVLKSLIVDETFSGNHLDFDGEIILLPHELFTELAQTETPQGMIGVCSLKKQIFAPRKGQYVLVDGIQDPGNLGTIIRTADAFGLDGIFFGKGTADLYNQKVLRSAQGSHFHIPVYQADLTKVIPAMQEMGVRVYGTSLSGVPLNAEFEPKEYFALLIGNEGAGVDPVLNDAADHQVKIQMWGNAESMNVAVAAGILMHTLKKAPLA
jgi:TrmH family RNA methyltransferase